MRVHVVAVQADMRAEHYASANAFAARILELTREAVRDAEGMPTLVAFPEAIGLPLTFAFAGVLDAASVAEASRGALRNHVGRLARCAWRHRRVGPSLWFLLDAERVFEAYSAAFRAAALDSGATIVAGSVFLPHVDREAARGVHVADPRVRNVAHVFGPRGTILGRTAKRYLMPDEARAGLVPASESALAPVHTPLGRIGTAICLDVFYESVIERLDGLSTEIVVQPSANHAPWDRPWPPDPSYREGEAWLRFGLRARIQDREHVRIGVNPMLVGSVLDLEPRGRSTIVVNERFFSGYEREGWKGVAAMAPTAHEQAFVRATFDLSGDADARPEPTGAASFRR